ncbi:MAG: hypothetical protein KDI51_03855 [Xanthomonadales bacterium]|nr:hypothetical protein [Xanthomonadales bacterium]MCB1633696.1 hypothetical protein [Xanthomonadales bacterium]
MLAIELQSPSRVAGEVAAPQSLWFLLRLWLAAQPSTHGHAGWLRAEQLREQFPAARHPRMIVSRAFADLERWGVRAGWGTDRSRPLPLLRRQGRSRGPFWLAPGQAEQLQITLHGQAVDVRIVAQWLDCADDAERSVSPGSAAAVPAYWSAWSAARRDLLDGRLIIDGRRGALAGYRRAQAIAVDDYQEGLALLQQAIVWRRAGDADAAQGVLEQIDRRWRDSEAPAQAWLGAMSAIVRAWCAYARRELPAARRILAQARRESRWAALFQAHPRVVGEHANLLALIERSEALDEQRSQAERDRAATAAIAHYQQALASANEAESFDAAAAAASNLGWTLWLLRRCGLRAPALRSGSPLQWIGLSAAMAESHRIAAGVWNTIYLLRVVRDGGGMQERPAWAEFRRWPVLSPEEFAAAIAPVRWDGLPAQWCALAQRECERVERGELQVDALQRANLLLELAWYEAHQGNADAAAVSAQRLRRRLRELAPSDRSFFRQALRRLPE